jgi:DNA-binding NtrC family response regulator
MQDTSVLFLGNRRDLASVASLLVEQFADVACDFRSNLVEARELLKRSGVRLILYYWNSDDARNDFDALVKEVQLRHHKPAVIVITDADRPAVVLHVLRHGAVDCLCRPVNPNRLKFLVGNLIGHSGGGTHTPQSERGTPQDTPVTFQSDCMRALVDSL